MEVVDATGEADEHEQQQPRRAATGSLVEETAKAEAERSDAAMQQNNTASAHSTDKPATAVAPGNAQPRCLLSRRLVFVGDSTMKETMLDLCEWARGRCRESWPHAHVHGKLPRMVQVGAVDFWPNYVNWWHPPKWYETSGRAATRRFGLHYGLRNMVSDDNIQVWETLLSATPNTTYVINSGLHDVATPTVPRLWAKTYQDHHWSRLLKPAPLDEYRANLRWLTHLFERVRQRTPGVQLIWKLTQHQPAAGQTPCQPGSHPDVVNRLNEYAQASLGATGVVIWAAPAELTFTARDEWFWDGPHSGQCNQADLLDHHRTTCHNTRLDGRGWYSLPQLHAKRASAKGLQTSKDDTWRRDGGLSKAVTATLLPLLGCTVDGGKVAQVLGV
jgi:hypothetical protein